jgi:hypothetical protein
MDAMTDFLTGYEVATGAGLGGDPGLKASRQSTGGALSVFETSIDAGPPLPVHDREDECFAVLDGSLSVRCGGDEFHAAAGSFVFLPATSTLQAALSSKHGSVTVSASASCPDEPAVENRRIGLLRD